MIKLAVSLALTTLLFSVQGFAQADDYAKRSKEIANEIWSDKDPIFALKDAPAEYKNESAVILSKKYTLEASARSKFKMGILTMAVNKEIIYRYCLRERVKIQDKSALDDFSEISYEKFSKRSTGAMLIKMRDKSATYIGTRVIKKDGSVKETMLEEAVSVKDEKNIKENKLAIPDLQIGDVLDFFIQTEAQLELTPLDPIEFLLASDYPILNYAIHGNVSKKYAIEYKNVNNAPDFKISKDEDNDIVFSLEKKNLSKITATQWYSGYRQLPYVKLHIFLPGNGSRFKKGEISKGLTEAEIFDDIKADFSYFNLVLLNQKVTSYETPKYQIKEYLKKKKDGPALNDLQKIALIYQFLHFNTYLRVWSDEPIVVGMERNTYAANNKYFAYTLSLLLKDFDIDNELVVVSGRYSPELKDFLTTDEPKYLVHTLTGGSLFLADNGILSGFGIIPGDIEGEPGVTLQYGDSKSRNARAKDIAQGKIKIPVSSATANLRLEKLQVKMDPGASQTIEISRQVRSTGLYKKGDQISLLYFEDYYDEVRKSLNKQPFWDEWEDTKKNRAFIDEYKTALVKVKSSSKDNFLAELKNNYDKAPKELKSFAVDSLGVLPGPGAMQYSCVLTMDDFLKKAGNNFIFEVGKLIGTQTRVTDQERTRTVDIYMPFARTLAHNITINIPAGYTVEGIESLQKDVSNESGYFKSKATLQGDKLYIDVSKQYSHNFDPAANWSKILTFVDAANDFTNTKVLLRKK